MRKPALIVLSISLIIVCALCGFTAYAGYTWFFANISPFRLLEVATVSGEIEENQEFHLQSPASLEVYTDIGDIQIQSTQDDAIQVTAIKKAWADNEADALSAAEDLYVEYEQIGNTLRIAYRDTPNNALMSSRGGSDSVSFTIDVPEEISVKLTTNAGGISLTGITGAAELASRFGDVTVESVDGSLSVASWGAVIEAKNINSSAGVINLETTFSDIVAEELSAEEIHLKNDNGKITAEHLDAENDASFESGFGDISISDLTAGALEVTNQNGRIDIEESSIAGSLIAGSSFGDVRVIHVEAGDYRLSTTNGILELDGASGDLDLENNFGDITITNAAAAALNVKTTNGTISFSGTLDESAGHKLENNFGDILLYIPAESEFTVSFETDFGQINSELPLTLTGAVQETKLDGRINGGGSQLTATTTNGNISLFSLDQEK